MAQLSKYVFNQWFDNSGAVLNAGTVTVYDVNTTNLSTIYSDEAETALDNPFTLNASGRMSTGALFLGPGTYDMVIKNSAGDTIETVDDYSEATVTSKTPSEYQIAIFENVASSKKLTNAQTEDTYDFKYASTGITLGGAKKFFFRDAAIYIHSNADGYLDLMADTGIRLDGNGETVDLSFIGDTNTGVITWNGNAAGDKFEMYDDIEMQTTEKIYFRDSDIHISSANDGYMDLVADLGFRFSSAGSFNFDDTDSAEVTFTFDGTGANTGQITWDSTNDKFTVNNDMEIQSTAKIGFNDVTAKYIYQDGTDLILVSDADIYLAGTVKFGTHSAIGAETVTGYISIEDSGGTVRKVAIVS